MDIGSESRSDVSQNKDDENDQNASLRNRLPSSSLSLITTKLHLCDGGHFRYSLADVPLVHEADSVALVSYGDFRHWPIHQCATKEAFMNIHGLALGALGRFVRWLLWLGLVIGVGRYLNVLRKRRS